MSLLHSVHGDYRTVAEYTFHVYSLYIHVAIYSQWTEIGARINWTTVLLRASGRPPSVVYVMPCVWPSKYMVITDTVRLWCTPSVSTCVVLECWCYILLCTCLVLSIHPSVLLNGIWSIFLLGKEMAIMISKRNVDYNIMIFTLVLAGAHEPLKVAKDCLVPYTEHL